MVRRAFLYGFVAAVLASLWTLLGHFVTLWPFSPLVLLVPIAAIVLAILAARKVGGGRLGFNDAFIQGVTVSAVYAVFVGVLALVVTLLIPVIEAPAGSNLAVVAPIDGLSAFGVVGMNLAFGCLISLIAALALRRA